MIYAQFCLFLANFGEYSFIYLNSYQGLVNFSLCQKSVYWNIRWYAILYSPIIHHCLAVRTTLSGTKLSILKQKRQKQRLLLPQASFPQGAPICSPQGVPKPALFPHGTLVPVLSLQGTPVPTSFPHAGSTCATSFSTDSTGAL